MTDFTESASGRSRERDLDLYVEHELATGSPAGQLLWQTVWGWTPPPRVITVTRQDHRGDGRSTDVVAEWLGHVLLVENKAAGGSFTEGQAQAYADHCEMSGARAVLVAPRSWLHTHPEFHAIVAVEDLAAALQAAAQSLEAEGPTGELRRSYEHRARVLGEYARASVRAYLGNPNEAVSDFGKLYRDVLAQVAGPSLRLTDGCLRNDTAWFASLRGPGIVGAKVIHKVTNKKRSEGRVDLLLGYGTLADLEPLTAGMPDGWVLEKQPKGRQAVLCHRVASMNPQTILNSDAEPVIADVAETLLELGRWLKADGQRLLSMRSSSRTANGSMAERTA
jgi:hypothetical protein